MGTQHVAESACEAGVERFVFASSASVYGEPKKLPMSESDEADPRTPEPRRLAKQRAGRLAGGDDLRLGGDSDVGGDRHSRVRSRGVTMMVAMSASMFRMT